MTRDQALNELRSWMGERGWKSLPHQEETWAADERGEGGLICVPTGSGKTYAAYFSPLAEVMARAPTKGLKILWVTPLRAMTRDLEAALRLPVDELGLQVTVASRTGDTSSYRRKKLRQELSNVLLTTPESLSLMLSYKDMNFHFTGLNAVVVDEWHELASSKRGTQTELALARLRALNPDLRTWALSATVGNLRDLAQAAVGIGGQFQIITGVENTPPTIEAVLPPLDTSLPWFGYIGATMFDSVVKMLDDHQSTLVFTNTRNQAERWFQAIIDRRPDLAERAAIHHGSLDASAREEIEAGLNAGALKVVVCTSSLDLGVDYADVDQVIQIGSPMSIARLLQRAGRAGHRPGALSHLRMVPTHAMQLIEFAALKSAVAEGLVESIRPITAPLDVLIQHMLTMSAGPGFMADELFEEVRTTHAYQELSREVFDWALSFVEHGGQTLQNYPAYHKVVRGSDGLCQMPDSRMVRDHRMAIGTITSSSQIRLKFLNGQAIGHVDENYVARMKPGDRFVFGGRTLELVSVQNMEARVRATKGVSDHAPRWLGSRMAWSDLLASKTLDVLVSVRERLDAGEDITDLSSEVALLEKVFKLQYQVSKLPGRAILGELATSRDGSHLFLFPFAGRAAHEGLAALLAHRLSARAPVTLAISVNDMGLELCAAGAFDFRARLDSELFETASLEVDALASVNAAELGRRQFREIARVAGMVSSGLPSKRKSTRQLQTSAGLLYDVFARWEPENLLLQQAREEVLQRHFDRPRLYDALRRLQVGIELVETARFSPLAFPLVVDRVQSRISTETQQARLERMMLQWVESCG